MKIKDQIYGEIEIDNQLIRSIVQSRPFQRLKEVNQYGGVNFVFKDKYQVSRYEHSIGVWYVTKRLGGSVEEQVAALLHDIGHKAFSHIIEQALSDPEESMHEEGYESIEGYDEVIKLLKEANLDLNPINTYSLIKMPLPDVGTDRLDYAMRDYEGVYHKKDLFGQKVLKNLTLINKQIHFTDIEIAIEFAERGNEAMYKVIYDPNVAVVYQSLVDMLRIALKKDWIGAEDMFKTDREVFAILKSHRSELDDKYFRLFKGNYNVKRSDEDYDFKFIKLKARYFDPRVVFDNGDIKRLSHINNEFAQNLEKWKAIFEESKRGVGYKVEFG